MFTAGVLDAPLKGRVIIDTMRHPCASNAATCPACPTTCSAASPSPSSRCPTVPSRGQPHASGWVVEQANHGCYDGDALDAWAGRRAARLDAGRDVYCCFDNDGVSYAAGGVARLRDRLITQRAGNEGTV